MSRRGGKNRPRPNTNRCANNGMYWQSYSHNEKLFIHYRNMIMQMAMNRFRWINLPKDCDARFLEWTLLTEGVATIVMPKSQEGHFYSTKCVLESLPNVYDNYTSWLSIGNNGWRVYGSPNNGTLVWDNSTRYPIMSSIELYARELAHITLTKEVNRFHQQIPFILTGPPERKQDMINLMKQVAGGELAILTYDTMDSIEPKTLMTGTPFLGEELAQDEKNTWNRVFTLLGIANTTLKMERQTEDEIESQQMPTTLMRMASLTMRREAANYLNNNFADYLEEPIQVVWREDNESTNWNAMHNINKLMELGG